MKKVIDEILSRGWLKEGSRLVAGVSGGADSMALACILYDLKEYLSYDLVIMHIHHGLRGPEADRDLNFVRAWARDHQLPFVEKHVKMDQYAQDHKLSQEEAGRILRRRALLDQAGKDGLVALAHSQDDQAETVLHRIIRGTGPDGLQAMVEKNGPILRPLLRVSRREILAFLRKRGQDYCLDSTNLEDDYTRNYIRHHILKELKVLNPQIKASLARLADLAALDKAYFQEEVQGLYHNLVQEGADYGLLGIQDLKKLPPALRFRLYREVCNAYASQGMKDLAYKHLLAIDQLLTLPSGKGIDIHGLRIERTYDQVIFFQEKIYQPYKLREGDQVCDFGSYSVKLIDQEGARGLPWREGEELWIRPWKKGDRILLGGKRVKVKEIFQEKKIPRPLRGRMPVLVGEEIYAVAGCYSDHWVKDGPRILIRRKNK